MSEQGAPDNDQYGPPVPDGSEGAEMGADGADANGADAQAHAGAHAQPQEYKESKKTPGAKRILLLKAPSSIRPEAIAKETPQEKAAREREEMAARGRF